MKTRYWLAISGFLMMVAFWLSLPDDKTRVVFCNVGQGDGVLVTRGSFQMVYDVGPENGRMRKCMERYMAFWDRVLEVVVISHWDGDHSGGLGDIGKSYKIEKAYSGVEADKWLEQKIYTEVLRQGDVLRSDWFSFVILWPEKKLEVGGGSDDDNYNSLVGILKVAGKKILLTGDVPSEVEQRLIWREVLDEEVDVVKVGHHGSGTSTSEELLEEIKAKLAVISVGRNSFGHPARVVLERLESLGVEVKRTDEEGDVVLVFEER